MRFGLAVELISFGVHTEKFSVVKGALRVAEVCFWVLPVLERLRMVRGGAVPAAHIEKVAWQSFDHPFLALALGYSFLNIERPRRTGQLL
jgi:hypothetical protein